MYWKIWMKKIQNGLPFSKQRELFMGNYDGRSIKTQIVKKLHPLKVQSKKMNHVWLKILTQHWKVLYEGYEKWFLHVSIDYGS